MLTTGLIRCNCGQLYQGLDYSYEPQTLKQFLSNDHTSFLKMFATISSALVSFVLLWRFILCQADKHWLDSSLPIIDLTALLHQEIVLPAISIYVAAREGNAFYNKYKEWTATHFNVTI